LQQGSYPAGVDRRLIGNIWPTSACKGAAVTVVAGTMTANVAPGNFAVPAANGTGSTLCVWDAPELVTFAPAPGSGLQRIDTVYILPRGNDLDGGANNDFVFGVATGTAGVSGTYPSVPAGSAGFWSFVIQGGSASLNTAQSIDYRPGGLDTVKSGRGSSVALASDVALTASSAAVPLTLAVVAGQQYLIGFEATFWNPTNAAVVSAWLQDVSGFPVATSGAATPATAWASLSGTGIYTPAAGTTQIGLDVMASAAGTTLKYQNAAGASKATLLWLVPI
jgi:hypothetical protein